MYVKSVLKQQSSVTNTETHFAQQHSLQSSIYVTGLEDREIAPGREARVPRAAAHIWFGLDPLASATHTANDTEVALFV